MRECLRFLQPRLSTGLRPVTRSAISAYVSLSFAASFNEEACPLTECKKSPRNHEVKERLIEFGKSSNLYPRVTSYAQRLTCRAFNEKFQALENTETLDEGDEVSLQGRE